LAGKFLLTEIAHKYSAVFLMEKLEEVIRIGDDFYEAKQDINDEDDEDKIRFDNVYQLIVEVVEKHVVALLTSRLQQGMGELQLLSKPSEEEMSAVSQHTEELVANSPALNTRAKKGRIS